MIKKSARIEDIARRIKGLTFEEMMAFSKAYDAAAYSSGASRCEKILAWADEYLAFVQQPVEFPGVEPAPAVALAQPQSPPEWNIAENGGPF